MILSRHKKKMCVLGKQQSIFAMRIMRSLFLHLLLYLKQTEKMTTHTISKICFLFRILRNMYILNTHNIMSVPISKEYVHKTRKYYEH